MEALLIVSGNRQDHKNQRELVKYNNYSCCRKRQDEMKSFQPGLLLFYFCLSPNFQISNGILIFTCSTLPHYPTTPPPLLFHLTFLFPFRCFSFFGFDRIPPLQVAGPSVLARPVDGFLHHGAQAWEEEILI